VHLISCFRRGKQFPAGWFCFFTCVPGSSKGRCGSPKQGKPRATGRYRKGKAEPLYIWPSSPKLFYDSGLGHLQHCNHEAHPQWQVRSKSQLGSQAPGSASGCWWTVTRPGIGTVAMEDLTLASSKDRILPLKATPSQRTRRARAQCSFLAEIFWKSSFQGQTPWQLVKLALRPGSQTPGARRNALEALIQS